MEKQFLKILVIFSIVFFSASIYHEKIHEMIFDAYGVPHKLVLTLHGFGVKGYTKYMKLENWREMEKLHLLNDMIAYNLLFFSLPLYFLLFVVIVFLFEMCNELRKVGKKLSGEAEK